MVCDAHTVCTYILMFSVVMCANVSYQSDILYCLNAKHINCPLYVLYVHTCMLILTLLACVITCVYLVHIHSPLCVYVGVYIMCLII